MPIYEYRCRNNHITDRVLRITEEMPKSVICRECRLLNRTEQGNRIRATLVPSRTAKPILKAGIGGFYKPNA